MTQEKLLERVQMLYDEIHRIKCMLESHVEWPDMDPYMNDEIYLELASYKKSAKSEIERVIEHLLKLKYSRNNYNHSNWKKSVYIHIDAFRDLISWGNDSDTNIVNDINDNLEKIYHKAIDDKYSIAMKRYSDLEDGPKYFPGKCPWTLKELAELSLDELLDKLPDPDELTVQMQLYLFCRMITYKKSGDGEIKDELKGYPCSNCKHYTECIAEYYDRRK